MNPVEWLQQLPRHMSEAIGGIGNLFTIEGLRRLVLFALLALTAVATAVGLTDLIRGSEAGRVDPIEFAVVGALAAAAILTMWLSLEFVIGLRSRLARTVSAVVYLILVLWSISFGFGFYWKHLASIGIAQDQTKEMVERVSGGLDGAARTFATIQQQLTGLSNASNARTEQEQRAGGACDGVASSSGAGPYWNLRGSIKNDTDLLFSGMGIWLSGGQGTDKPSPLARIGDLQKRAAETQRTFASGTKDPELMRNTLLDLGKEASEIIREINSIVAGRAVYVARLRAISQKLREGYSAGGLVCRDSSLADNLALAATQLEALRPVETDLASLDPQLGPRATRHAFNRLWANAFSFLPGEQVAADGGLALRDLQALVAAIVVDIGIFFLTVFGRPDNSAGAVNRLILNPLPNRELRRRLYAMINTGGAGLRGILDASSVFFEESCYLIASEQLPVYGALRNLQIILLAAGEGTPIRFGNARRREEEGSEELLAAIQRTLVLAASALDGEGASLRDPADFLRTRMAVLRLSPQLMFALQRFVTEVEAEVEVSPVRPVEETARRDEGRGGGINFTA
jgi:hypothetical protein